MDFWLGGAPTALHATITANMKQHTRLYAATTPLAPVPAYPPIVPTAIQVVDRDTIDAALTLKLLGFNPVAINLANEDHPGGGVETGAAAQEESEFRRSNYHESLYLHENPHLRAQMIGGYKIPETGVVYSPNVQVFRIGPERGFEFMAPQTLAFIAVAAYDLNPAHHSPNIPPGFNLTMAYINGMKAKIRTYLRVAILENHDAIVAGALGCGAFQNDPNVVSQLFLEVLQEPEFAGRFLRIVFAVINDAHGANFTPFHNTLDGQWV